jgi:glycosyltransferase involved in cell wall biosynthesis
LVGVYRAVLWQASSEFEKQDILRVKVASLVAPNVMVAPNLISIAKPIIDEISKGRRDVRTPGSLRIVFLSRIAPKKNLDYLLSVLNKVDIAVDLSIYGPTEDPAYWSLCQGLIKALPIHIKVTYQGEVAHEHVAQTFAAHDVFIFPTRGENFGHVIYEALAAGTAVLLSDQTPWVPDSHGAVKVLALENLDAWVSTVNQYPVFTGQDYAALRSSAVRYVATYNAMSLRNICITHPPRAAD